MHERKKIKKLIEGPYKHIIPIRILYVAFDYLIFGAASYGYRRYSSVVITIIIVSIIQLLYAVRIINLDAYNIL